MPALQRELYDDVVVLSDDALDHRRRVVQVALQDCECLPHALPALWPGGMLNKVLSEEIERRVFTA
jgi:hypothetical protein